MTENEKFFFSLLRSGLWDVPVDYVPEEPVDWKEIYWISVRQTVVPLVADGIGHYYGSKPEGAVQQAFVSQVIRTELRNLKMDECVSELFGLFAGNGIKAWLVKGQGVARTYLDPQHRQPGDIDLLFEVDDYRRARELLEPSCYDIQPEGKENLHLAMKKGGFEIELHGTIKTVTDKTLDKRVTIWYETVKSLPSPEWECGDTHIVLPPYNFDALFIFLHFFHHYLSGGLGLRQICDWVRYLHRFNGNIDKARLESDVEALHVKEGWQGFAALAVKHLGCDRSIIPFYSDSCSTKAEKIISHVMAGGNFGKYGDSRYRNEPYFVRKAHSLMIRIRAFHAQFLIFPKDASINFLGFLRVGFGTFVKNLFQRRK